ncbi:MAG: hypothetical protein WB999_17125 [Candidatus Binataceae bacterium]
MGDEFAPDWIIRLGVRDVEYSLQNCVSAGLRSSVSRPRNKVESAFVGGTRPSFLPLIRDAIGEAKDR